MSAYIYNESWKTRFGKSERTVVRDSRGRFLDNVSKAQLKRHERQLNYTTK